MIEPDLLSQHLDQSRRMGRFQVIMFTIILVNWVVAMVVSGFAPVVIFTGAGTLLLGVLFAYRGCRADILETDRLIDAAIEGLDLDSADDLEDDE